MRPIIRVVTKGGIVVEAIFDGGGHPWLFWDLIADTLRQAGVKTPYAGLRLDAAASPARVAMG